MNLAHRRLRTLALLLFILAGSMAISLAACVGSALAQDAAQVQPGWGAQLVAWATAHPLESVGLVLYLLTNLAVRLSKYPRTAGVGAALLVLADWISIVPHRDSPGLFSLPGTRSTPPAGTEPMSLTDAVSGP